MPRARTFAQVDVFTREPLRGNPLAVVVDAGDLSEAACASFAAWTNLSETTFLLPPTDPGADYRVRIFTPGTELPFAGHPTLGSCAVWLAHGGLPRDAGVVVQECGAGLIRIRRDGDLLAFAAPPLVRSGPADDAVRADVAAALRLPAEALRAVEWVDNGPGWVAALLEDADTVLALAPDFVRMGDLAVGVIGPHRDATSPTYEVRAFCPGHGVTEDPVTGSLNAGLAQWLISAGAAPAVYTAIQGTALGRSGRVHVEQDGADTWIGGAVTRVIDGTVTL
jgi:PhzF family phenazine biosynthesis protein